MLRLTDIALDILERWKKIKKFTVKKMKKQNNKKKKKFKPAYQMTRKEKQKVYDRLSEIKIEDCE